MDIREELPASPSASALARRALDGWLSDLVGVDTADAARVAASELVANAVQHGGLEPDDTISLVGSATDEVVRVNPTTLEEQGRGDIMIVVGGVIPPQDYPALYEAGAKAIFGPGTPIAEAAIDLLKKLGATAGTKQAAE